MDCKEIKYGSAEYKQTIALRQIVLRDPLGLQFGPDELGADKESFHLTCWSEGALLACVVLSPLPGKVIRMRQLAVSDNFQGLGVGRTLVTFLEKFVRELGYREIVLHARDSAVRFYENLDYTKEGERFVEVSIPHYTMRKCLINGRHQ